MIVVKRQQRQVIGFIRCAVYTGLDMQTSATLACKRVITQPSVPGISTLSNKLNLNIILFCSETFCPKCWVSEDRKDFALFYLQCE